MTNEMIMNLWENFFTQDSWLNVINTFPDKYLDERSIEIEYSKIDDFSSELSDYYLNDAKKTLELAEKKVRELLPPDLENKANIIINVRIINLPKLNCECKIRELRNEHLNKATSIKGIVRRAVHVRPRIIDAKYKCERCYRLIEEKQNRFYLQEPQCCHKEQGGCGRSSASTRFKLQENKSKKIDTQKIEIQELSEGLPIGSQPQRLVVYLDDDLTGIVNPGNKIIVNGYCSTTEELMKNRKTSATLNLYFVANSIEIEEKGFEDINLTELDVKKIKELSLNEDIHERIKDSIAPSIYGMDWEKRALSMHLVGGNKKEYPDKTRVRGDIHILIIGDPGTGKSQLLTYIASIAPHSILTSGKSTTNAGLTASAIRDDFGEGGWTIEAGALPLADGGHVIIDEIDKMPEKDRTGMHEGMEQQKINVSKAGLITSLNSRCAVLAGANPKEGRFESYNSISDQIGLPSTLISRFDMVFPIKDEPNKKKDSELANHILSQRDNPKEPKICRDLLRKYIAYARSNIKPRISEEAKKEIQNYYLEMRTLEKNLENNTIAITPRQLESLIRMTEASAKLRLSQEASIEDAKYAIRIMRYYLGKITNESGILDIDLIEIGSSHSQRFRANRLMKIINTKGELNKEELEIEAHKVGYPLEKINQDLKRLEREGRIFITPANKIKVN